MIFKQCISVIVCISLLSNQMLFAGSLDLDISATQKTSLDVASNGVPIVNITTPNAQGLSHNKFINYNVEQKGLILNNSNNVVQTQLAGFIASNPNFNGSSAKTILNEVTGTNRSLLNGYTEVAGDQADVIVANPNGISINGGGFINTPKVTLSTGKPELLNGQVSGFDVSGGDILIEGEGFNAAANSQVDLYTKVLMLNAKLHAQSLNIVTGENQIASDGTITSKQATGTGVSLDSSALGGIYAQKITLVGTDKGVGVNLPPEVLASNGAINISSDGKITFQKATASQSITAASTSSDIEINGAVSASNDILIYAKESIINNDVIIAGVQADGSANTASTLALQASSIINNKSLYANGSMSLAASSLVENKDTLNALESLHVKTNSLKNSGSILSDKTLNIEAQTNITNDGIINGGNSVDIISNGTLTNNNIISSGLLSDGSTNDTATLNLQASDITNTAKIFSHGSLDVSATTLTNRGYFSAYNALQVNATTLNNYGVLFSGTDMNLWVSDLLYNYENANILAIGNLVMAKDASLAKTKHIVNEKATIETIEGDISLYAENFENKTDGLVKGTKLIGTETLSLYNSTTIIATAFIIQVRDKLMSEGKYQTLIGASAKSNCTSSDFEGCLEEEIQYNGISEKQVIVTKSYVKEWDTYDEDFQFFVTHHAQQLYDIKYVTNDDTVAELNILLAKFGLNARYGYPFGTVHLGIQNFFYSIPDLQGGEVQRQITVTSNQEYMISKNAPAKLLSGKKLSINADTITNYLSEISSNDDLEITGNTLNNGSEVLFQIDTRTGQYLYQSGGGGLFHNAHYSWAPLPIATTYTQTDAAYALIYSAKNITGNLATVNNIDIKSNQAPLGHSATTAVTTPTDTVTITAVTPVTIDPKTNEKKITLPTGTNGLFVVSTNPTSQYLVETNPAFASFSNFISSDYMLSRLGYNADATTKRLGDAFYENRLVRDSIFEQTGKRYLASSLTNDSDQFKYLMDNALLAKDDLKLTPYVSLSLEQITALTKDIVWMETREIEGQKVLVPIVYIANATISKTTDNGAKIIANGDINLNVETITNQGDIKAGGDIAITASKNIYNEGGAISSAENMTLQAGEGIYNISSELSAKALSITAATFQSDIASQDITHTYTNAGTQNSQLLSNASTIKVQDDITIKTTKNLSLIGTTLNAGGDLSLSSSEGNIAISSKTHTDSYDIRTRRGYNKGDSTQEISSSINANSISMNADNLLVNASDVTANNDMNIKANNIAITSGEDRVYTDSKYALKGGFMGGKKKTADTSDKKTVIDSTLNAKNLNIDTKSLSIQGSKLTAVQANIASEVIELISLKNSDYESHFSDTSGMMTRTIASKGHIKEEVVSAFIQVQNQLIINNKDVTNQLKTDNILKTITSQSGLSVEQIKLVEAYAKSEAWDKHTTSLTGMGSLIIAAIVTVCTMGAGGYLVGLEAANAAAVSTAAIATETGTAAAAAAASVAASAETTAIVQAAVVQSIVTQVANALVTAAITGNSPNLDTASIIKGAVLAGVLTYTSPYTNLTNYGFEEGAYTTKMTQAVVNASVKTAITGNSFQENIVNEVGSVAFNAVGHDLYNNSEYKEILPPKAIVQGLVGGALAKLQGGDFTAGAISTATSHAVSEYMINSVLENFDPNNPPFDVSDPNAAQKYTEQIKTQIKAVSSLVGGTVALATNKDLSQKDLDIAQSMSDSVQENNAFVLIPSIISALALYANAPAEGEKEKIGLPNSVLNPAIDGAVFVYDVTKELLDGGVPTEAILIALAHKLHISESAAKKIVDDVKIGKSSADALRLRTDLAFQEAGILTRDGKLTEEIVKKAEDITPKVGLQNPSIVKELTKDGSKIEDWGKYKTDSVKMPNGQSMQIHFYKNNVTGKIDYATQDYKVKGVVTP